MDCSNAAKAPTKSFAICQASPSGNVAENVQKIIEWMKNAAKSGAEIALFGELFLSDYNLSDVESLSVPSDGVAAITIANAAKEIGIAVVFGYSEVADGRYYNSLMFIDKHGERIANYRKVHVWPTEAGWYTPGDTTTVVDWEGYRVGLGICADVCMHEYVSAMVLRGGAQMVIIINALVDGTCYVKTPLLLAPARAYENRCYIVYVDLAGERYEGMSRLYNPLGDCVVSACTHEEVLLTCTIPLYVKVPYTYHTLRRPEVYSAVVSYETELPWRKRSREDVKQYFTKRACYYDKQMEYVYNGPSIAAHALAEIITGSNKSKKILDVAAGTGLVGKALSSEGFTNIIALDMSESMLEHLKQKKVYKDVILGEFEQEAKKIPCCTFYVCMCVGGFLTSGFLNPAVAVREMVRIAEKGGYVLLLWNATELENPQCTETQQHLEQALQEVTSGGLCQCIQRAQVSQYLQDCTGSLTILQK